MHNLTLLLLSVKEIREGHIMHRPWRTGLRTSLAGCIRSDLCHDPADRNDLGRASILASYVICHGPTAAGAVSAFLGHWPLRIQLFDHFTTLLATGQGIVG